MATLPMIYNAAAGGRSHDISGQLREFMRSAGRETEIHRVGRGRDTIAVAAELAEGGAGRLVVAGGDGTINEVINGIAGSGTELAIIPTGTANVLALELGIPLKIEAACTLAARGRSVAVDLGIAGERYFALMAGAGFDALVIKNINPLLKRTVGRAAFPISGLQTFFREGLPRLSVSSSDRHISGYFAVASNARYYGGRFGPSPLASMTDGLLDICVLKDNSLSQMLRFWAGAVRKGSVDRTVAESFRASEVLIECPAGADVPVQTDGEIAGSLPTRVSVLPGALRVCAGSVN